MSRRTNQARAAAVSRALRAGGLHPVPSESHREGIRVRHGYAHVVRVTVSVEGPRAARRLATDAMEILVDKGYLVTGPDELEPGLLSLDVHRPEWVQASPHSAL